MAIKQIKRSGWQRQWHMATAGLRAGMGWAGSQVRTLGLPADVREEAREAAMREHAQAWVSEIGQLKGSVVKVGQILATYADYCLPEPLAEALHTLEADTEPLAWTALSGLVQETLAERYAELIIEPVPLASASLSQVHRARVKRSCEPLCLKILYPGIASTLDSDLAVLQAGLGWWLTGQERERFQLWLGTVREVLLDELDLTAESRKLQHWHARLAADSRFVVPTVWPAYSSAGILAMSYEQGLVPHDPAVLALPQARRNRLASHMLELFLREILLWGEMQSDPHPGNYRIRLDEKGDAIVLLDFGSVRPVAARFLQPLRDMLLAAYRDDRPALIEAVLAAGLLSQEAPETVQQSFADVLAGLIEPLNYRRRRQADPDSVPAYAVDEDGHYCWAAARLPKRMGKQALQSAVSQYFAFPGADFLLLSRKLAGVYAFIAGLDARFDASVVMEKVIGEMPDRIANR